LNRDTEQLYAMNPFSVMQERVVIAMVGLPARGKSYISQSVVRFLNFIGCPAKLFNAGNVRRTQGLAGTDASFFDASNSDAKSRRDQMAMDCLDELLEWLRGSSRERPAGCACAIFDATNTTRERRQKVISRCAVEPVMLLFLESVTNDEELLSVNYRMKLGNDDYKGRDAESSLNDFIDRVKAYEKVYEPITEEEVGHVQLDGIVTPSPLRYIQIIDAGRRLVAQRVQGYLLQQVLNLMHSLHLGSRVIWLVVVGESENDKRGIVGGNEKLSEEGVQYTHGVVKWLRDRESELATEAGSSSPFEPAMVITGTLLRYVQMAELLSQSSNPVDGKKESTRRQVLKLTRVNDTCMGLLDSMTYEDMEHNFPDEVNARNANKLYYRCPGAGGESYIDVAQRIHQFVLRLEQTQKNLILVADRAVIRCVLAYFEGIDMQEMPTLKVAPGVHELRRGHSGYIRRIIPIGVGKATVSAGPGTMARHQRKSVVMRRNSKIDGSELESKQIRSSCFSWCRS
jgi:6-phosphofructo-2-kinase